MTGKRQGQGQTGTPHVDFGAGDRVVIEDVRPALEGGFPVKRVLGEELVVEAAIFAEADQAISAVLKSRRREEDHWLEVPMLPLGNDQWRGRLPLSAIGCFLYTVEAWIDPIRTWHRKAMANSEHQGPSDLETGIALVRRAMARANPEDEKLLRPWLKQLLGVRSEASSPRLPELPEDVAEALVRVTPRLFSNRRREETPLWVEPVLARQGAWYQIFPRSCSSVPERHGTFRDLAARLERIAAMGFDVVCMPPIHPIGLTGRKGRRGSLMALPGDPGSPWAVGGPAGGHKAIHPELGTLDDFHRLVSTAERLGMKLALDIALHCSPDHPYLREHPGWFTQGTDGTIECVTDGDTRYHDVLPLNFYPEDREELWNELAGIFDFWLQQGVQIFRVDNPHTKPMAFWRWLLPELKRKHPELILVSEGLTRPRLQHHLCKLGFSLTYDYFPWRTTKQELSDYYGRLVQAPTREFLRPLLWPNTPQYLPPCLQHGGRAAFMLRFILAATLGASYGIYGPAFEFCAALAEAPGSTEYADSEQFAFKIWEATSDDITDLISTINRLRRENDALKSNDSLTFHATDNDSVIAYSKSSPGRESTLLMLVSLDPHHNQSGWVTLALAELGLCENEPYIVEDLLSGNRYQWRGSRNYFSLQAELAQAHLFRVRSNGSSGR